MLSVPTASAVCTVSSVVLDTTISPRTDAVGLSEYPWIRQPEDDYIEGCRVVSSVPSLEGEIAIHREKCLCSKAHRRYSCHVMLAFGILCKGLTYY